jgi:hypothetical protein
MTGAPVAVERMITDFAPGSWCWLRRLAMRIIVLRYYRTGQLNDLHDLAGSYAR